jgi:molybdopterin biosynthesis enzyme
VDIVLVIGGTGPGIDDHSAAALAEAGELAIHSVALRPGETAGLGHTVRVPVVLLPGMPAALSVELRAVRRTGNSASRRGVQLLIPARFGAKRLKQHRDWRISENISGVQS